MTKRLIFVIERYVEGTPRKGFVKNQRVVVCKLPHKIKSRLKINDSRVYLSTKSLKHIYDTRNRTDFEFIKHRLDKLIIRPVGIYQNKIGKTGDICVYSEIDLHYFFTIIDTKLGRAQVISVYKLSEISRKRRRYLAGYKLLWSRKGDLPSS